MSSSSADWTRARDLYVRAVQLPEDRRALFLRTAVEREPELRALIEPLLGTAEPPAEFLEPPGSSALDTLRGAQQFKIPAGSDFAGYRIEEIIGHGATSTVYRAVQQRPRRTVALKVLRGAALSPRMFRRFEHESELLARLKHPHIAQVYEAGTGDTPLGPQPFIAMELVVGEPITHHTCDVTPDRDARLRLFVDVCRAVHHAHQRGIVHRDIKPANVLVERDGTPKVLDFGVARVLETDETLTQMTQAGELIGTLPYMSPEQASGRVDAIDVRSDIYSLGMVLFEVLTGELPYSVADRGLAEATRIICEQAAPSPGGLQRELRGDLSTVVLKALEKDPERRYASVAAFSDDIERVMANEPILATPPSATYQLRKLVARHKLPFGLSLLLLIVLVAAAAGLAWLALNLADQRDAALAAQQQEREAHASSEAFAKVLSDLFGGANPGSGGTQEPSLRQILDDGYERASEIEHPVARARLLTVLGGVYGRLDVTDRALLSLESAVKILRETPGDNRQELSEALMELGQYVGGSEGAELASEAIEIRRESLGDAHPLTGAAWNRRGTIRYYAGDFQGALADFQRTYEIWDAAEGAHPSDVADALASCGECSRNLGRLDDARAYLDQSIAIREQIGGLTGDLIQTLEGLGMLIWQRDPLEAEPYFERVVAGAREVYHASHPKLAFHIRNYAYVVENIHGAEQAEPLYREAAEIHRTAFGGNHRELAHSLNMLGKCLVAQGKLSEAVDVLAEAAEIRRAVLGPEHDWTKDTEAALANARELLTQSESRPISDQP